MNVAGEGVGALSVRAVPKPQKRIKDKVELIAIVAKREGKTAEEVAQAIGVVL